MTSRQFYKNLTLVCMIAIAMQLDGCGIFPEGPDKKSDQPLEPSFNIQIESVTGPGGEGVLQGHYYDAKITTTCETGQIKGLDLLLTYEPEVLTPVDIDPGDYFIGEYFESFEYDILADTLESDGSIIGIIRITTALRPIIITTPKNTTDSLPSTVVKMKFLVTNDRKYECYYSPLRFYWNDCNDNRLLMDKFDGYAISVLTPEMTGLNTDNLPNPGWHGPVVSCFSPRDSSEMVPVEFINGGVDIICIEDIDCRGDINANGLQNEIADAYLYATYFAIGLYAFGDHVEESILASDVNRDGMKLSVADLVYLIRLIEGNAVDYDSLLPGKHVSLTAYFYDESFVVSESETDVGAVWMRFRYHGAPIGDPYLTSETQNMDMIGTYSKEYLNIIIFNIGPNSISSGKTTLVNFTIDWPPALIEADASDFNGAWMKVILD